MDLFRFNKRNINASDYLHYQEVFRDSNVTVYIFTSDISWL